MCTILGLCDIRKHSLLKQQNRIFCYHARCFQGSSTWLVRLCPGVVVTFALYFFRSLLSAANMMLAPNKWGLGRKTVRHSCIDLCHHSQPSRTLLKRCLVVMHMPSLLLLSWQQIGDRGGVRYCHLSSYTVIYCIMALKVTSLWDNVVSGFQKQCVWELNGQMPSITTAIWIPGPWKGLDQDGCGDPSCIFGECTVPWHYAYY